MHHYAIVTKQHTGDYKLLTFYEEYIPALHFVVTKNNSFHIEVNCHIHLLTHFSCVCRKQLLK